MHENSKIRSLNKDTICTTCLRILCCRHARHADSILKSPYSGGFSVFLCNKGCERHRDTNTGNTCHGGCSFTTALHHADMWTHSCCTAFRVKKCVTLSSCSRLIVLEFWSCLEYELKVQEHVFTLWTLTRNGAIVRSRLILYLLVNCSIGIWLQRQLKAPGGLNAYLFILTLCTIDTSTDGIPSDMA